MGEKQRVEDLLSDLTIKMPKGIFVVEPGNDRSLFVTVPEPQSRPWADIVPRYMRKFDVGLLKEHQEQNVRDCGIGRGNLIFEHFVRVLIRLQRNAVPGSP